jgi:hypothetical protein
VLVKRCKSQRSSVVATAREVTADGQTRDTPGGQNQPVVRPVVPKPPARDGPVDAIADVPDVLSLVPRTDAA